MFNRGEKLEIFVIDREPRSCLGAGRHASDAMGYAMVPLEGLSQNYTKPLVIFV